MKPYFLLMALLLSTSLLAQSSLEAEIAAIERGLLKPMRLKGEAPTQYRLTERMQESKVPGVSVAVVKDGVLRWAKGYGIANTETGTAVTTETLFQAGSISKPVAALAVLKLVDEGRVDLDTDVNTYLKDWKVPDNPFTVTEKVTLRRLLTHTAGMTVHGFPGYAQTDTFPTDAQVLNGLGNTPAVVVDTVPGSRWRYSGGGYTVMERVVENVTGQSLADYLDQQILPRLGMNHSTYAQPLPADRHAAASAAYNTAGELIPGYWHNYPEQAAAGLWTTPTELANYAIAIQAIAAGKEDGVLSPGIVAEMLTKHANDWGLGPALRGSGDSLLFQHGGKNEGFTNMFVAAAYQDYAVIVMTNADNGGGLMAELIRSVGAYYGWPLFEQQEIETVAVPPAELAKLAGAYLLDWQQSGGEEYRVAVRLEDGRLVLEDPNEGVEYQFVALGENRFLDMNTGNKMTFEADADTGRIKMSWNGNFDLYRVE